MKGKSNERRRIHRSWRRLFVNGILGQNPVLTGGLGFYLVLTGCRTLDRALVIAGATFCLMLLVCALGSLFGKKLAPWLRLPFVFLLAAAGSVPLNLAVWSFFPQTAAEWGLCGILLAANSALLAKASKSAVEKKLPAALAEAAGSAIGYGLVLIALSGVWMVLEALGLGEAFGKAPVVIGVVGIACLSALLQYFENRLQKRKGRVL